MYLKLPVYVERANFIGNWHVAGFPAMTAFDGFVHGLERKLRDVLGNDLFLTKWSVIVNSAIMETGRKRFVCANSNLDGNKYVTTPTVDERHGNLDAVIVIEVQTNKSVAEMNLLRSDERLVSIFSSLRLAGGKTTVFTSPYSSSWAGRCIEFFDTFYDAVKKINRQAFLIEDKTAQIPDLAVDGESKLQTIIRLIRKKKHGLTSEQLEKLDDAPEGLFVPLAVGYIALEEPSIKSGGRDPSVPHAYAEPIIGLGRARKLGSVLYHLSNSDSEENIMPFWSNDKIFNQSLSNNTFAVTSSI